MEEYQGLVAQPFRQPEDGGAHGRLRPLSWQPGHTPQVAVLGATLLLLLWRLDQELKRQH